MRGMSSSPAIAREMSPGSPAATDPLIAVRGLAKTYGTGPGAGRLRQHFVDIAGRGIGGHGLHVVVALCVGGPGDEEKEKCEKSKG